MPSALSPKRSRPAVSRAGRRGALCGLAAFALAPLAAAQAPLARTPAQAEGPFYPRTIPADRDSDLTRVAGRSGRAKGTVLYFSGRVLARDGRPLVAAVVELWQCDSLGRYHHVGDQGGPLDEDFQGYGTATTDAAGRYEFTTIRPVAYPGRPPHLHVIVRAAGSAPLTTQVYVRGDATAGDGVLGGSPQGTLERLSMALAPGREPGSLAGTFDFVL